MNLGDLLDSRISRENLRIGPFETTDSNMVEIYGGNVAVEEMNFFYDNNIRPDDFLMYDGNALKWKSDNQIFGWAFKPEILLSLFSNVDTYVTRQDIKWDGSFESLSNIPNIDLTIPVGYDTNNFYRCDNNLSEFRDENNLLDLTQDERKDIVSGIFKGLGSLSFESEELPRVNNVIFKSFRMNSEDMKPNSFAYSKGNLINNLTVRNEVIWNNPFIDDNGDIRPSSLLVDDFFNTNTSNSSVKVKNILKLYQDLDAKIETANQNLNVDRVKTTIINKGTAGEYLSRSNLLGDISDIGRLYKNLNIGSLSQQDSNHVKINDIIINQTLTFPKFREDFREDFREVFFTIDDVYSNLTIAQLPHASNTQAGIVQISNEVTDIESYMVPTVDFMSNSFKELTSNLSDMDMNLEIFFDDLNDPPDGILDSNLSGYESFSYTQLERLNVYHNLELPKVAYTGQYQDLKSTPKNVNYFNNDIGALSKYNSFGRQDKLNTTIARNYLQVGTISEQNKHNVNITGGEGNFSYLYTKNLTITPPPYTNVINNALILDVEHRAQWHPVSIASEKKYGIVKTIDDYKIDARDAVVYGKNIKDLFFHFNEILNVIENDLLKLEAESQ